jgi:hypothetical protein
MKIKFKVKQSTSLAPAVIIGRIVSKLDEGKYRVNDVTVSSVEFDEEPVKLMWNFEAAKRLDGGRFEINSSNNEALITFTWYSNLLTPALIIAALSIFAINHGDYYAPLFFVTFFTIAIGISMLMKHSIARSMLSEILE